MVGGSIASGQTVWPASGQTYSLSVPPGTGALTVRVSVGDGALFSLSGLFPDGAQIPPLSNVDDGATEKEITYGSLQPGIWQFTEQADPPDASERFTVTLG